MKTVAKKVVSLFLACVVCLTLIPTAFAATTVSKVQHSSTVYGGGAATVFYVNAKNTKTTKVEYYGTAGRLKKKDGSVCLGKYGYYEVLVYGKQSNGTWKQISKTNLKNDASDTISMKGYKQYKVRVYDWRTSTIGSYIGGSYNSSACWVNPYLPSAYFKAKSNISSLTK